MTRLSWVAVELPVEGDLLGEFTDVFVGDEFLARVAKYQKGPWQGRWIVVNVRTPKVPAFMAGKAFTHDELRRNIILYGVRRGFIKDEDSKSLDNPETPE